MKDLHTFFNSFDDIALLVHSKKTGAYTPHDRTYLNNQVVQHLKRRAGK